MRLKPPRTRPNVRRGANQITMEPRRKDKPVIPEKEVVVPLDPAHEENPTLVEREQIELEQARKEQNQPASPEEKAVCARDEAEIEPAEEGEQSVKESGKERRSSSSRKITQ